MHLVLLLKTTCFDYKKIPWQIVFTNFSILKFNEIHAEINQRVKMYYPYKSIFFATITVNKHYVQKPN